MEKAKSKGEEYALVSPDVYNIYTGTANVTTGLALAALTQEVKELKA